MIRLEIDKRIIFIASLFVFCSGCDSKNEENKEIKVYEYYPNGAVKEEITLQDSLAHGWYKIYYESGQLKKKSWMLKGHYNGESIEYYENGNVESVFYLKNNISEGPFKVFYKNGNIQYSGVQKNNAPYKWHYEYHENDSGKVWFRRYYVNVNGIEEPIREIEYDENGNGKELLPFVDIVGLQDTIVKGQKVTSVLNLKGSNNDFIHYIIGDFDDTFKPSTENIDTLKAKSGSIEYTIDAKKAGEGYLRGIVLDEKIMKREGKRVWTKGGKRYFEFTYFVK